MITGGSSGIGLATVRTLLAEGASVAFCGRDQDRVSAALGGLADEYKDHVHAAACDVRDAAQVDRFRIGVTERFGGVDILVNNAGRARTGTFAETGDDDWRDEFELKFFSVILPTRAFLPELEASDHGAIVVVNALLARQPEPHLVVTASQRAGVLNLTKSLSVEFAPKGIRVNSVLIGVVDSGQWLRRYEAEAAPGQSKEIWLAEEARSRRIPLGRFGRPEEAANAIAFLASPAAGYTTGATLEVAGGVSHFA